VWRETTKHPRNLAIFREELDAFLPKRILDFHVHVASRKAIGKEGRCCVGGHWIAQYTFQSLDRDLAELYPGRETFAVCFGFPRREYDFAVANRYVAEACRSPAQSPRAHGSRARRAQRFFPLRLFDPDEPDRDAVRRDLEQSGFLGIKPYHTYVAKTDPASVEIRDMLPGWIMDIVQDLGLIVMLHIPRPGRLADPINQSQLADLCARYPAAKIVLAHIGRAYFLRGVVGHLDALRGFDNLWYDLAMLNHWEVLEHLFRTVRPDRVLYATDIPIALAPGKSVEINHQYTYVTPVPWELSIADAGDKIRFTSFAYEELRAIKHAVERLGLGADFVEDLMFRNGMRLLESAGARVLATGISR
jgi:hypothetical protein